MVRAATSGDEQVVRSFRHIGMVMVNIPFVSQALQASALVFQFACRSLTYLSWLLEPDHVKAEPCACELSNNSNQLLLVHGCMPCTACTPHVRDESRMSLLPWLDVCVLDI